MKKIKYITVAIALFTTLTYSQVGVGTTTPQGALDVNSATNNPSENNGFIYPVVSLEDVTVQEITNPNGLNPNIVAGTVVYNTNANTPANIENTVYPGIYVWNGSVWVPQFAKQDSALFEQVEILPLRTGSDDLIYGDQLVTFDVTSNYPFRPKFNGRYKIKLTVHYGAGAIDAANQTTQFVNFGAASGVFNFTFNGGTTHTFAARSFSGYNTDRLFNNPQTATSVYSNNYTQTFYIIEEILDNTNTYTFNLTFNQAAAPGFQVDGDLGLGDGRGYVTINDDVQCMIEFTYIGE